MIRLALALPALALSDALRVGSDVLFQLGCQIAGSTMKHEE